MTKSSSIYTDGSYESTAGGSWHLEDSPFKAQWILEMLSRHPELKPRTVCEIGCGVGGILAELQKSMPADSDFIGYEISPKAHSMSRQFVNPRLQFVLGNAYDDDRFYDLVLVMDVVEHVENCFEFMRQAKAKGRMKIFHIPLDAHVSAILRGRNSWDTVGHIHIFTKETVLKSMQYSGLKVIDWTMTTGAISLPDPGRRTRLANLIRRPLQKISPLACARLLGGNSMLVLAE